MESTLRTASGRFETYEPNVIRTKSPTPEIFGVLGITTTEMSCGRAMTERRGGLSGSLRPT